MVFGLGKTTGDTLELSLGSLISALMDFRKEGDADYIVFCKVVHQCQSNLHILRSLYVLCCKFPKSGDFYLAVSKCHSPGYSF